MKSLDLIISKWNKRFNHPKSVSIEFQPKTICVEHLSESTYFINQIEPFCRYLRDYGVEVKNMECVLGPSTANYLFWLNRGVKFNKIKLLKNEIQAFFETSDIWVRTPVEGTNAIGVEVPRRKRETIFIQDLLNTPEYKEFCKKSPLVFPAGKSTLGEIVYVDITKAPHILIGGTTGSGKSVCIHSILTPIISNTTEKDVEITLIDPKRCELRKYDGIPHTKGRVFYEIEDAVDHLEKLVFLMEERMRLFEAANVVSIEDYRKRVEKIPYNLVVVEEFADLMLSGSKALRTRVETYIARLAQKARSAGIHLVVATQKPTANVIPTLIKSNFPTRLAFKVVNSSDSRVIIDKNGAESLIGNGDMILKLPTGGVEGVRLQGCFVPEFEIIKEF